jgi:hypothetical protein
MKRTSWLDDYIKYTGTLEAPSKFHVWTGLTVMAHTMGRRVYLLNEDKLAIFPGQMMTLLIGPSGVKKTTAIEVGRSLLREARLQAKPQRINLMGERMSGEALYDDILARDEYDEPDPDSDAVGLLIAPEMGSTFANQSYMEGMSTSLTRLYDAPIGRVNEDGSIEPYHMEMHFKKDGGRRSIRNPCIGMLAATTPEGLRDQLPPTIRTTGFIARLLSIWAATTDRAPHRLWATAQEGNLEIRARLVAGLAAMTELEGPVRLTPEADAWTYEWYEKLHKRRERERNALLASFLNRMDAHVLRVATVLAGIDLLGRDRIGTKGLWLEKLHVEHALKYVNLIETQLTDCYALLVKDKRLSLEDRLLRSLERQAYQAKVNPACSLWVTRIAMVKRMWDPYKYHAVDVDAMVAQLATAGKIVTKGAGGKLKMRARTKSPGPWSGTVAPSTSGPEPWENGETEPWDPEELQAQRELEAGWLRAVDEDAGIG